MMVVVVVQRIECGRSGGGGGCGSCRIAGATAGRTVVTAVGEIRAECKAMGIQETG